MRLKYNFEKVELENKFIAVPIGDESDGFQGVIKMNETAVAIFELLKEEIDEMTLISLLEDKYDVSHSVLVDDVRRVLADFREKGLLI